MEIKCNSRRVGPNRGRCRQRPDAEAPSRHKAQDRDHRSVLGLAVVLYLVRDLFANLGNYNLLIFFLGIGGFCIIIGLPIAFAFGVATVAYVACATTAPPDIIVTRMETGMSHILLLSVPLFILLGSILEIAGMANKLVAFLGAMVGHFKGGLSYVLVGAMVFVSGISGAKAADMAAIAPVLLPEMKRRGVKDSELVGLLASSSAMSETIPPSLILIMTGAVMGISIGALFNAGWLPALVLAGLLCIAARIRARHDTLPATRRASGRAIARLALVALPVLVLPFLIRGAVVEGVATATEVATIGIAYVLIVTLVLYRVFDWRRLFTALKDASILTGVVFLILATANAMAWAFVQSGFVRGPLHPCTRSARRSAGVSGCVDSGLHRLRQHSRGHPRRCSLRSASFPHRTGIRHFASSLRNRGDPGNGGRPVCATLRHRLLHGVRNQPRGPRRGGQERLDLPCSDIDRVIVIAFFHGSRSVPSSVNNIPSSMHVPGIVVRGGVVIADSHHDPQWATDVWIRGSTIEAILPTGARAVTPETKVIEAGNCIVMPGLIDTHRHLWQTPLRGLGADLIAPEYRHGFVKWSRNTIGRKTSTPRHWQGHSMRSIPE